MHRWPKRLLSQAANSQNSVSTRPSQARTRPDAQLTALFHAVLCCAIQQPTVTEAARCPFLPFGVFQRVPSDCAKKKKKEELSRQTNAAAICVYCVYMCSGVTVRVRLHAP